MIRYDGYKIRNVHSIALCKRLHQLKHVWVRTEYDRAYYWASLGQKQYYTKVIKLSLFICSVKRCKVLKMLPWHDIQKNSWESSWVSGISESSYFVKQGACVNLFTKGPGTVLWGDFPLYHLNSFWHLTAAQRWSRNGEREAGLKRANPQNDGAKQKTA